MSNAAPEETPDLCVVGTLAFDDIETPSGVREGILGGSATYFSVAATCARRRSRSSQPFGGCVRSA